MNNEIKKLLEDLKSNIPIEEYRSEATSDGLTHYEEDKDSWQYRLLDYITNLQKEKIQLVKQRDNYKSKVENTLGIAFEYGQIDGSHHRVWCIDQMVRELADDYDNFIQEYEEDGEYKWDIGIHP